MEVMSTVISLFGAEWQADLLAIILYTMKLSKLIIDHKLARNGN